jgi:hypothetical protein
LVRIILGALGVVSFRRADRMIKVTKEVLKAIQGVLRVMVANLGSSPDPDKVLFSICATGGSFPFEIRLSYKAKRSAFWYTFRVEECTGDWDFGSFFSAFRVAKATSKYSLVEVSKGDDLVWEFPESMGRVEPVKVPYWYQNILNQNMLYTREAMVARGILEDVQTDATYALGSREELLKLVRNQLGGGDVALESFTLPWEAFKAVPRGLGVTIEAGGLSWDGGRVELAVPLVRKSLVLTIDIVTILRSARSAVRVVVYAGGVTLLSCGDYGFVCHCGDGDYD